MTTITKAEAFELLAGELDGWLENEDETLRSYGAAYLPDGHGRWDLSDVDPEDLDNVAGQADEFQILQADLDTLNDPNAAEAAKIAAASDACEVLDRGIMQNLRDDYPCNLDVDEHKRYADYRAACAALGFPV